MSAAEIVDTVRALLAARGAFDVADGLFAEGGDVVVLVVPDEPVEDVVDLTGPDEGTVAALDADAAVEVAEAEVADLTDQHGALDLVVTVRAPEVLGLAGTPISVMGAGGRRGGELDERGRARIRGVVPGRARLQFGPLRGLAPVVPLHQRRNRLDGVLDPPVPVVSRELAHAAQTGRRVGPAQHWRSVDGTLSIELAESDERRLLLTVSRRAEDADVGAVRVRWEVHPRDEDGDAATHELVTPLAPGFGGRRASVRYDLGSAEVFGGFGIVAVDAVPLDELTEQDLRNALGHGPYGSALRSWQAVAEADACPSEVASSITAQLGSS